MNVRHLLGGAVLLGTAAGYVWSAVPSAAPSTSAATAVAEAPAPAPSSEAMEHSVYYAYCDEARAAGAAPIYAGQPGYRSGLDGDSDGVACEPYRGI